MRWIWQKQRPKRDLFLPLPGGGQVGVSLYQTGSLASPLTNIGPVGRPVGEPGAGSSVIS